MNSTSMSQEKTVTYTLIIHLDALKLRSARNITFIHYENHVRKCSCG